MEFNGIQWISKEFALENASESAREVGLLARMEREKATLQSQLQEAYNPSKSLTSLSQSTFSSEIFL